MTAALATELRTIRVYGTLADLVGCRTFRACVSTVRDAVSFLIANFPQVEAHIKQRHFRVKVSNWTLGEDDLAAPVSATDEIHIIPAICGAGGDNAPLIGVLAGVALIGIGLFVPGAGPIFTNLGIGLLLTGISALISPTPEVPEKENDPSNNYNFSRVTNTSVEGVPVPLVYGEIVTGSVTISLGVIEDEQDIDTDFVGGPGDPCPFNDPDLLADGAFPGYTMPGDPYKCGCPEQLPGLPSNIPPPPDDDGIYCDAVGSSSTFSDEPGQAYFWTFKLYLWVKYDSAFSCSDGSYVGGGAPAYGAFGSTQDGVEEVGSIWTQDSVIGEYVVVRTWKTSQKYVCTSEGTGSGNILWKIYYYRNGTWNVSTNNDAYYLRLVNGNPDVAIFSNNTNGFTSAGTGFYSSNYPAFSPVEDGLLITEKYEV